MHHIKSNQQILVVCVLHRVLQIQQLRSELPGVAQCQSETQRTHQDPEDQTQTKHTLPQIIHRIFPYNILAGMYSIVVVLNSGFC